MSQNEIVSVIVPLHNEEVFLRRCLKSILSQTYPHLEVIVVDDNSTDRSMLIARRVAVSDSRVKVVSMSGQRGAQAARFVGVEEAKGEMIMFVDSDDMLRRQSVQLLVEAMRKYDVDLVQMRFMRRFRYFNFRYGETFDRSLSFRRIDGADYVSLSSYIGMDSYITPSLWGKLYRTSLMRMINRTPFDQFWGDDQICNIDYLRLAHSIAFIDYSGYIYRWGGRTTRFRYSDLQKYKNVYKLKLRQGQDRSCLDSEMKLLLRYYIRQLYTELGWTRDAIVMCLRPELDDPMWRPIVDANMLERLVDAEFSHVQQNAFKAIAKRFLR